MRVITGVMDIGRTAECVFDCKWCRPKYTVFWHLFIECINVTFTNLALDLSFPSKMPCCHRPLRYIGRWDLPPMVIVNNSFYPRAGQQAVNLSWIFINYYRYRCFPASAVVCRLRTIVCSLHSIVICRNTIVCRLHASLVWPWLNWHAYVFSKPVHVCCTYSLCMLHIQLSVFFDKYASFDAYYAPFCHWRCRGCYAVLWFISLSSLSWLCGKKQCM